MGLDMSLYGIPKTTKIETAQDFFKYSDYVYLQHDEDSTEYCKCLSEWRKAYPIDGWFCKHCEPLGGDVYKVTREQVIQLVKDCADALLDSKQRKKFLDENQGKHLFSDLDWLKDMLAYSIRVLSVVLETTENKTQFIYYASW